MLGSGKGGCCGCADRCCCCCLLLAILFILLFAAGFGGFGGLGDNPDFSPYLYPSGTTGGSGGTFDEDCFVKLVRKASNNQVSKEKAKEYRGYVEEAGSSMKVNAAIVAAIAEQESRWINHENSGDGLSRGIMQIQTYDPPVAVGDEIWRQEAIPFALRHGNKLISDIMNEQHSILGGGAILRENLEYYASHSDIVYGNPEHYAIAAYNAGKSGASSGGGGNYLAETWPRFLEYQKCLQSTSDNTSVSEDWYYPLPSGFPLFDPFEGARYFKADRGSRWHAGVDLIANYGTPVYAITTGKIINYYQFTPPPQGLGLTYTILVNHGDFVINYAEVGGMTTGLSIGSEVKAGQQIGFVGQVSSNAMLHFEKYNKSTTANRSWYKGESQPTQLLDPSSLIQWLTSNGKRK